MHRYRAVSSGRARLRGALAAAAAMLALAAGSRAFAVELQMPVPAAVVYPGQSPVERGIEDRGFRVKDEKLDLYATTTDMLQGLVASRTLVPGRPILLSDLKQPDIVKAGKSVTLVYQDGGLFITGLGVALRSASAGETVQVRNADSGVIVSGIVGDDGTVKVSG